MDDPLIFGINHLGNNRLCWSSVRSISSEFETPMEVAAPHLDGVLRLLFVDFSDYRLVNFIQFEVVLNPTHAN